MDIQDIQLTEEVKEKLKGYLGFDVNSTFLYVPKVFRQKDAEGKYLIPKDLWPVFKLKGKDGLEYAKAEDTAGFLSFDRESKKDQLYLETGKERINTLRAGLKGWKNWYKEDFKTVIPWNQNYIGADGLLREKHLAEMKVILQVELQEAINERSILTEEELRGLDY